jgi:FtsZ-binding cell division protein ZapB
MREETIESLRLQISQLKEDNTRAWERVAQLESTNTVLSSECSRLTSELARTYS